MPYSAMKDINPALKGIKPKITLSQANVIAKWADKIKAAGTAESPWAVAISQFKKSYSAKGGKWMKKKVKEASRGYFTSGTATVEISALDVDGQKVPVSELVAAYQRTDGMLQPGGLSVGDGGDAPAKDFTEAVAGSLEDYAMSVKDAFRVAFKPTTVSSCGEVGYDFWPRDVFDDDPRMGTTVVVRAEDSQLYAVEYKETDEGFSFATRDNWRRVVLTYMDVEEATSESAASESATVTAAGPDGSESQLSESASGRVVGLAEGDKAAAAASGQRAPLLMDVALIEPGWGNDRDNNYYSREMLGRDARVFEGVKMYSTGHKPGQKNVITEVSVIKKVTGFTDSGAPIAQVAVHDPDFAEATRNRKKLGTLETLECSILALGRTTKGTAPDGKEGNIVESITSATSVDWVPKAGAGGRAVALAENITKDGGVNMLDKKEVGRLLSESGLPQEVQEKLVGAGEYEDEKAVQEAILAESGAGGGDGGGSSVGEAKPTITYLAEAEITEALKASGLPAQAQARLTGGKYLDQEALKTVVESERAYIKELTGSGRPFAQGGGAPVGEQPMSEAEYDKAYDDIARRHGLYVPEGKE